MTTRRGDDVAFTLSVGGRLDPSTNRAFGNAGRLVGRLDRQTDTLTRSYADQRRELGRLERTTRSAFDTRPIDRARVSVRRLNRELDQARGRPGFGARVGGGLAGVGGALGGLGGGFGGGALTALSGAGLVGGVAAGGAAVIGGGVLAYRGARSAGRRAEIIDTGARRAGVSQEGLQSVANLLLAGGGAPGGNEVEALERSRDILRELDVRLGEAAQGTGELFEQFQRLGLGAAEVQAFSDALRQAPLETILELERLRAQAPRSEQGRIAEAFYGGTESEFIQDIGLGSRTAADRRDLIERARRRGIDSEGEIAYSLAAERETQRATSEFGRLRRRGENWLARNFLAPASEFVNDLLDGEASISDALSFAHRYSSPFALAARGVADDRNRPALRRGAPGQFATPEERARILSDRRERTAALSALNEITINVNVTTDGADGETIGDAAARAILDAVDSTGGV